MPTDDVKTQCMALDGETALQHGKEPQRDREASQAAGKEGVRFAL